MNRPDIRALVGILVKEKVLSKYVGGERIKEAVEVTRNVQFRKYWLSSSYVPMKVAMEIQKENTNGTKRINFKGAVYECTFNCEGRFDQSQIALLFTTSRH